jgi:conserved transporter
MCATIIYSAFRCKQLFVMSMGMVCLNANAQGRNDTVCWPPYSLFVKSKFRTSSVKITRVFRDEDYAKPKFPGGEEALKVFIDKEKIYPEDAQDITGRVLLSFFVEEDG